MPCLRSSRSVSLRAESVCGAPAGGLSGFKSVSSTCLQTMAIAALISMTWLMFGYSLSFGHNWDGTKNRFIGGASMFWFWGDGKGRSFLSCVLMIRLSKAVVSA
jgi:ammonia channel protein AmtB